MSGWNFLLRILTVVLLLLVIAGLTVLFLPKTNQLKKMQKQKTALEQENRETERKISELKEMQHQFNSDPSFVERMAREAGLMKSNEVIFRISEQAK